LFILLVAILITVLLINFYHGGQDMVIGPLGFEENYKTNLMLFKADGDRAHLTEIIKTYKIYSSTNHENYNKNKRRVDIIMSGLNSVDAVYNTCIIYAKSKSVPIRIKIELQQYNYKMSSIIYKLGKFNISDKLDSLSIDNPDTVCVQHITNLKIAINNFNTSLID
jgi:hypothetical protein